MKILIIIPLLLTCLLGRGQEDTTTYAEPADSVQYNDATIQQWRDQRKAERQHLIASRRQQQVLIDSTERPWLRDSLGVHDTMVTAIFVIRNRFLDRSDSIYFSRYMDFETKQEEVRAIRKETAIAYKQLLGTTLYNRYVQLILRESARKPRGEWDTDVEPLTLEPI